MVEDLLNQEVFLSYFEWRDDLGLEWDGPLGLLESAQALRWKQNMQKVNKDEPCSSAAIAELWVRHGGTLPAVQEFAYQWHPYWSSRLCCLMMTFDLQPGPRPDSEEVPYRKRAVGVLKELKRRLSSVAARLRSFQPEQIRAATAKRDLGFVAFLMVACSWPDYTYAAGFILGLPAVGFAPNYGVFPIQPSRFISLQEVLDGWEQHNRYILSLLN